MLKLGIVFFLVCSFVMIFVHVIFLNGFDGKTNNVDVTEMITEGRDKIGIVDQTNGFLRL